MISKRRHRGGLANILPLLASIFIVLIAVGVAANDPVAAPQPKDVEIPVRHTPQHRCERLPTSLTYSQDSAPADVSAILRVVVEKINRDVTGVIDVEVEWTGAELHRRVGERIVRCTVTRLVESTAAGDGLSDEAVVVDDDDSSAFSPPSAFVDEHGRTVVSQCFEVPFSILDVNECTVPRTNAMAHQCPHPAVCVNTPGSYECACPSSALDNAFFYNNGPNATGGGTTPGGGGGGGGGVAGFVVTPGFWNDLDADAKGRPWDVSLRSTEASSCPGLPSTRGCCDDDGHSKEGRMCRSSFHCPIDPCVDSAGGGGNGKYNSGEPSSSSSSACASNAICERAASPLSRPNFVCRCPPGLLGNGRPCGAGGAGGRGGGGKGRGPKVKYDGKTPTEETARALESGSICGCAMPTIDPCDGFPKCPGEQFGPPCVQFSIASLPPLSLGAE